MSWEAAPWAQGMVTEGLLESWSDDEVSLSTYEEELRQWSLEEQRLQQEHSL
jgi:hypothetical protein